MILKFLELVNSSKLMGATNTLTCKFSSVTERLFRFQTLIFDGSLERSMIVVLEKKILPLVARYDTKVLKVSRSEEVTIQT